MGELTKDGWSPGSWRAREAAQQPRYEDLSTLGNVVDRLRTLPPLVSIGEIERLRRQLAEVAAGKRFLLQGGDCAEQFRECSGPFIVRKLKVLLQMSLVLTYGARLPVVRVARMAGQYAKPRSQDTEQVAGQLIPVFRGDNVNDVEPTLAARKPDPARLERGYWHSAATLNYVRALVEGGFASLGSSEHWQLDWVSDAKTRQAYGDIAGRIHDAIDYLQSLGGVNDSLKQVDFYTSHEALLLPYEEALTRRDDEGGAHHNLGAHFLWIGDRTRQLDGAHVEYARGLENPIGLKTGPGCSPEELVALLDRLGAARAPGRVTVITRYGKDKVAAHLPAHIRAVRKAGFPVIWSCDPMHGNTVTVDGRKTRHFDDVLLELSRAFELHRAEGGQLNGVHFELTGENVTECIGGARGLQSSDLATNYVSACDPRLNGTQSLEMAFLISRLLREHRS